MTSPLHPDLLQPGDAVRHYRVVRRLGAGGFSTVLLVEHEGREYSMKVATRPANREDETRTDERAFREAVALGHFRHPHLPEVRELGRWPDLESGFFFVVTDHVPGCPFNTWRWKTQASLYRFVGELAEVARVLAELHERGLVHRDLKADNILIRDGDERPFLIDFGSAYLPGAYTLTEVLPPSTFHNLPPECAAFLLGGAWETGARLPATPAMDLYAFGALLYEALTDCHPFNPRLPRAELALAIELLPPAPPLRLDPRVPPDLNELTLRLLAKKPEQRPPSARAVHEELMRMLEAEGNTEAWRIPYTFEVARPEAALGAGGEPAQQSEEPTEPTPRPDESPAPLREETKAQAPSPAGQTTDARKSPGWWTYGGLAILALSLAWVLLGIGGKAVRAGCVSAVEMVCSSAVTPEKGLHPMSPSSRADDTSVQPMPSRPLSGLCALLCTCAASAHLAACATTPVRPDMGLILEQCPPEARATARRLGLHPVMEVELETITCAGSEDSLQECANAINIRTGPVVGLMPLNDKESLKVTGEAKVFPDRVYISFDRVYPTPEGPPVPFCGVALNDNRDRFGVTTHAALPPTLGLDIDPAKVDRSPDAAVLRWPIVYTYVQSPEGSFQPRR
ncbi:MAG TPA: protein kinase [Archangium sp.]|uniref:serine/threonine protein kinase n=1 Tax=Archangium sp. TaxID=1872627 RepID=UPI002E378934|nr:protein kinase [Archangium sp.]HEX5753209.1 protein kinase [Archangium sp.]